MKTHILNLLSISFLFIIFTVNISAQHNFLGKDKSFIINYYKIDPEFDVFIDTINSDKILISCKPSGVYPYHTYGIDLIADVCISYGFISKNRKVLDTYIENLDYLGKIIKKDSTFTNFVYAVELVNKIIYYSINQPYADSKINVN